MKKLILVLIVLLAIGGAAAAYYMKKGAPEPTVTTAQITRGDIVETVGATGTLQAVETVDVGTQVSGIVLEMLADFNHIVKKGQVIARLDPSLIQTAVEQREASVTRAKADLDRLKVSLADAVRKHKQAEQLWAKQLIPRDQLDTAELNVKQLESQIKSSEAGLIQADADLNTQKVNLGHTIIKAPIDGIVISRNVDQGQTVQASMNAPTLYVIAEDLTKMQVLASIDESEVGKVRPGQAVNFRVDAYPTDTFHGVVSQIRLLPATVQNVVTYTTVIDVPNNELKLKPGMTATVNVEIARRDNVLRVPNAALRFRPTNDIFAALKQEVPPEMQRGGRGGPAGQAGAGQGGPRAGSGGSTGSPQGGPGSGSPAAGAPAAGAAATGGQTAPPQGNQPRPPQQANAGNQQGGQRRDPSAQGGGDATGSNRPRGEGMGGGRGGNMTEEERAERRKQFEERMKNMTPEQRAEWDKRMASRGQGGGRGQGPASSTSSGRGGNFQRGDGNNQRAQGDRQAGGNRAPQGERGGQPSGGGSVLARTNATTIDALFAAPPPVESRGRVWMFVNKQLKSVPVRYGITDGTWTELIETPETAPLQPNTELVINVVTGLEPVNRPGGQGAGNSPLMPQRGQPGRGGPGGPGGGGGGRGR